jgi:hypothetical protein
LGFGFKCRKTRQQAGQTDGDNPMNRSRAADDFATIRHRMDELRRERERPATGRNGETARRGNGRESDFERRRRERIEGSPPPWVPTIFVNPPRR